VGVLVTGPKTGLGSEIRAGWKWIALFGAAGLLVGFFVAGVSDSRWTRSKWSAVSPAVKTHAVQQSAPSSQSTSRQTMSSQTPFIQSTSRQSMSGQSRDAVGKPAATASEAKEISRLRARNGRLVALVEILRRRARAESRQRVGESGQ
jgi:hypothetical protein